MTDRNGGRAESRETRDCRPVFVVSTGRTGTQAIAHSLSRLEPERFLAVHEPSPSRVFRLLSNARMAGILQEKAAGRVVGRLRDSMIAEAGARRYVESNNFLFGMIDILAKRYDASIIHIVRHPADYADSHLRHGAFRGVKGMAGRFFPFWLARPGFLGYRPGRQWLRMSQHERLFWVWLLVNQYIEELGKRAPSQYRRIRFEDLFFDIEVYDELLTSLGVTRDSMNRLNDEMQRKANKGRGEAPSLGEADRSRLSDICGELANRYGYKL